MWTDGRPCEGRAAGAGAGGGRTTCADRSRAQVKGEEAARRVAYGQATIERSEIVAFIVSKLHSLQNSHTFINDGFVQTAQNETVQIVVFNCTFALYNCINHYQLQTKNMPGYLSPRSFFLC